jgi:4-amino-4-deoxy-L-arabinose transferase-like glycosyltransferase
MLSLMNRRPSPLLLFVLLFLLALGVRLLTWQDNSRDIWKVQTSVVHGYWDSARQLASGDFKTFVSDINHFGHPPGYSILLAAIFKTGGESTAAIHVVQILCDSLAIVLLFVIALELLPGSAALIAGVLAAISPQFAYFSVLLLPDSLVVLPILLAIYFVIRGRRDPRLLNFAIAGACIGLSCWFRANGLLLPVFVAATAAFLVERSKRLRVAAVVIAGAIVIIAPITIKNAIVYHRFVLLSLGAGQTVLEGIADYDDKGEFNIPKTDLGLMRQEAEWLGGKPEYAQLLFGRDGIKRDRARLARGFAVISSHPFWFAGVVVRRGIASTRLDPVPVVARESPVSRDITRVPINSVLWSGSGMLPSDIIKVKPGHDYVFHGYFKLEQGRISIKITDARDSLTLAANDVEVVEGQVQSYDQLIAVPFVSGSETAVRAMIANNASEHPVVEVGPVWLTELGPSTGGWLRYVRIPLGWVQRIFKTAVMLPLAIVGLALLIWRRQWQTLLIILTVPAYYLIVQSMLHTERRYVYVIHFFFLLLAATTLYQLFEVTKRIRNNPR